MGRRMNATTPRKNSTTNSTIGVIGWRIAHAEMFFTNCPRCPGFPHGPRLSGRARRSPAPARPDSRSRPPEGTRRRWRPRGLLSLDAVRDGHAVRHHPGHVHRRAARSCPASRRPAHSCPCHRSAPPSAAARCARALLTVTSARANAPGRRFGSGRQGDPHHPQAGLRIDDRARAGARGPDTPVEVPVSRTSTACPTLSSGRSCSATSPRNSTSSPSASAEQRGRRAATVCPTSTVRVRMRSVGGRAHLGAGQARLRLRELRGGDFDLGRRGHRIRTALLGLFGRQRAGRADRLGAVIFGGGELGFGARELERRLQDWRPAARARSVSMRASTCPRFT